MFAHAPKGTRIPVTLWDGPRILELEWSVVEYPQRAYGGLPSGGPTSCVMVKVLDPKTGAKDPDYESGKGTCIDGLAYGFK